MESGKLVNSCDKTYDFNINKHCLRFYVRTKRLGSTSFPGSRSYPSPSLSLRRVGENPGKEFHLGCKKFSFQLFKAVVTFQKIFRDSSRHKLPKSSEVDMYSLQFPEENTKHHQNHRPRANILFIFSEPRPGSEKVKLS